MKKRDLFLDSEQETESTTPEPYSLWSDDEVSPIGIRLVFGEGEQDSFPYSIFGRMHLEGNQRLFIKLMDGSEEELVIEGENLDILFELLFMQKIETLSRGDGAQVSITEIYTNKTGDEAED